MKPDVIYVPEDKCPLDVLAEMGERTKYAWIFFHRNAIKKLKESDGVSWDDTAFPFISFNWEATENFPETKIVISTIPSTDWKLVTSISADDIAFTRPVSDFDEILFLKMRE